MNVFEYTDYKVKGIKIRQNSAIPMTRGLGSSSACIIGGMLAANIMYIILSMRMNVFSAVIATTFNVFFILILILVNRLQHHT